VVVFSEWRRVLDILERVFESKGHAYARIDGNTSAVDRSIICREFNSTVERRELTQKAFRDVVASMLPHPLAAPEAFSTAADKEFRTVAVKKMQQEASKQRLAALAQAAAARQVSARHAQEDEDEDGDETLEERQAREGMSAMMHRLLALAGGQPDPGEGAGSGQSDVKPTPLERKQHRKDTAAHAKEVAAAAATAAAGEDLTEEQKRSVLTSDRLLASMVSARKAMIEGMKEAMPSTLGAIATGMTLKHGAEPSFWGDHRRKQANSGEKPKAGSASTARLHAPSPAFIKALAKATKLAKVGVRKLQAAELELRPAAAASASSSSAAAAGIDLSSTRWSVTERDGCLSRTPDYVLAARAFAEALAAVGLRDKRPGRVPPSQAGRCGILLITKGAGGVGMNLQGASCAVLVSPWWTGARDDQAICRVYRQHQTSDVMAFRLFGAGTIEANKAARQTYRVGIASTVQDDDPRSGYFAGNDRREGSTSAATIRGVGSARVYSAAFLKEAVLRYDPPAPGQIWCPAALNMAAVSYTRPVATRDQAQLLATLVSTRSPLGPGRSHYGIVDYSGLHRHLKTTGEAEKEDVDEDYVPPS
jgi:hypothetical protein